MNIWSSEIKDLEKLHDSLIGKHSRLDRELEKLVKTDDENMVLVYARRCLEVIITDLSERELNRPRGTEPLKGIIDKLNKEEKVPHNIIVSMQNLNSLSSFGAHPKDFDPRQVKPVLLDLTTALEWYLKYMETHPTAEAVPGATGEKRKEPAGVKKAPAKPKKRILLASAVVLVCAVIVVALILTDVFSGGKGVQAGAIESVLILPFGNYTGDEALDPKISGMHSSLISEIQRLSGLRVICKTSSDAFKGADMTVHEIAREMNVDAVIEPSVLCWGDTICTSLAMISGGLDEEQIWFRDFKEEKSKLFKMFNQITKQIAEEVKVELTDKEERLLAEYKTIDPEALDAYLKGNYYWEQLHPDSLRKGMECYQLAIEIEPDWAPPLAGMANAWFLQGYSGFIPWNQALPKTYQYLNKALDLDPNSAYLHYVAALVAIWAEWDWEKGEKEFLKSLELNSNHALARIYYAHLLMILRRSDEAVYHANLGLELDPMKPIILGLYGVVMTNEGDYKSAINAFDKALSINPAFGFAISNILTSYYLNGDYEKWLEAWMKKVRWNEEAKASVANAFHEKGHIAAVEEMLIS